MKFEFCKIHFAEKNGTLCAGAFGEPDCCVPVSDVRVAGADIVSPSPAKQALSAPESLRLQDVRREDGRLVIVQSSALCRVETQLEALGEGMRVSVSVENVSEREIVLENVSMLNLSGFSFARRENTYLYRFHNSHHCECQPRRLSLDQLGLFETDHRNFKRISGCNVGSWSSKEELPQAILEDAENGSFLFFQIESCGGWYWEIAEGCGRSLYLSLSGGNITFHNWKKRLAPGEIYSSRCAAVCVGGSLNDAIRKMTSYRRASAQFGTADASLPVIFNEYMYLSWDSPKEERTRALVPLVAAYGADVYVIDCGWHDDIDDEKIYPYVGKWRESRLRLPHGVRAITDYIRSFGMKAGLWIEPEVLGTRSGVSYPEEAYIRTNGERVCVAGRYFLDFRHPEVRRRMGETISRMVEEYGAQYIKIDCNQDCGVGTEIASDSCGEGLEQTTQAFWNWLEEQRKLYPDVIFESCSSGGMRMDWQSLRVSSVISASDQIVYTKFPYIIGNIFSAALPEQAAFWSYPVLESKYETAENRPTDDEVSVNMVNGIMGRMHLASDLRKLTDGQAELVREGVAFAKACNGFRRTAVPFLPFGFAKFGDAKAAVGLKNANAVLLAVWNLGEHGAIKVPLDGKIGRISDAYPGSLKGNCRLSGDAVEINLKKNTAVVLKIEYDREEATR